MGRREIVGRQRWHILAAVPARSVGRYSTFDTKYQICRAKRFVPISEETDDLRNSQNRRIPLSPIAFPGRSGEGPRSSRCYGHGLQQPTDGSSEVVM